MMQYKDYLGHIEYDGETNIFHGEVVNTRDVITFQGKSTTQLQKAFRASVDVYLDYCKKKKRSPDKPFSGMFLVRLKPSKHQDIYIAAKKANVSVNQWVVNTLKQAAHQQVH